MTVQSQNQPMLEMSHHIKRVATRMSQGVRCCHPTPEDLNMFKFTGLQDKQLLTIAVMIVAVPRVAKWARDAFKKMAPGGGAPVIN